MVAKTRGKNKKEEELEGSKALAEAGATLAEAGAKETDESEPPTEADAKIKTADAKDETDNSKLPTDAKAKIKKAEAKDETDESKPEAKIKKINPKMAAGFKRKNKKKSGTAVAKSQSKTLNPSEEEEPLSPRRRMASPLLHSRSQTKLEHLALLVRLSMRKKSRQRGKSKTRRKK